MACPHWRGKSRAGCGRSWPPHRGARGGGGSNRGRPGPVARCGLWSPLHHIRHSPHPRRPRARSGARPWSFLSLRPGPDPRAGGSGVARPPRAPSFGVLRPRRLVPRGWGAMATAARCGLGASTAARGRRRPVAVRTGFSPSAFAYPRTFKNLPENPSQPRASGAVRTGRDFVGAPAPPRPARFPRAQRLGAPS